MRQLRLLISAALASAVSLTAGTPPAAAAESPMPTRQAKAYGMDWVPYIDPADLPPLAERKAICLIDTGVAVTPDLPADNPEGPIVARLSVDGGSGLPGPAEEHKHGTSMASMASALAGNDWGTVGAWPGARIVSVRAMHDEERRLAFGDYARALSSCKRRARASNIVVASMSFGAKDALSPSEQASLEELVRSLQDEGVSVLVSAGNTREAPNDLATVPGTIPVAAGNTESGALCPYSSSWPGMLVGPGCGIDIALEGQPAQTDAGGSSTATVFAAALVALLRTLDPTASWRDAEHWLLHGHTETESQVRLDGEGVVRAAGLGRVVDRARARMSEPGVAPSIPQSIPAPESPTSPFAVPVLGGQLARPRASVTFSRGSVRVRLRSLSPDAERLRLWAVYKRKRRARVYQLRTTSTYRWRVGRRPRYVRLQLLPFRGDVFLPSVVVRVRVSAPSRP